METEMPTQVADDLQKQLANIQKNWPSDPDREERLERERLAAEDRENRERALSLWRASSVPARHAHEFSLPTEGPWLDALLGLKGRLGSGFLCVALGNRGTGKTQIGTCLIRAACGNLQSALYVKALDIFIALREGYRKEGDSEKAIISRFVQPEFLVIDAMEERGETPFEDRLLNHIIDKRYDNMADTLLITNQTPEAFAASAGPSIISRIHETGDKIVCDWDSFRKRPDFTPARASSGLPVGDR